MGVYYPLPSPSVMGCGMPNPPLSEKIHYPSQNPHHLGARPSLGGVTLPPPPPPPPSAHSSFVVPQQQQQSTGSSST